MKVRHLGFGQIEIDGRRYNYDVVIQGTEIVHRKKKKSRPFKAGYGHTPLSIEENIPWNCKQLVIGTGSYGRLPVMEEVYREAKKRGIDLKLMDTPDACEYLSSKPESTNAILHLTC